MKHNDTRLLQKKRVRAQQNFITVLCLVCFVFCAVWVGFAAQSDRQIQTSDPVKTEKEDSSSQAEDDSSQEDSSLSEEVSSQAEEESSDADDGSSEEEDSGLDENADTHPYAEVKDTADDLSDAVFVGDSRTVGMQNSTTYPKATFYCAVGLHINTALTDPLITLDNGNMGTVADALAQKQFGRVYINFGTNELGWPYIDTFKEAYAEFVDKVKELQPNAVIYAEGILPLTASKDAEGDSVNNTNAVTFSQAISEVAAEEGIEYLDCTAAVADENGYLPEEASTDGVHLVSQYCLYWQNFIVDNT